MPQQETPIMTREEDRSAFLAIVGRPNVGKSSLLNRMIGQKVAIVSSKPQTTRTRIMGVLTEGADQLVFLDTPGLQKPRSRLDEYMARSVTESVAGVDACLLVTEVKAPVSHADRDLLERCRSMELPVVLAINKIDTLPDKSALMEQIALWADLYAFEAIVPVSAQDGSGVASDLIPELKKLCQPGGHFFDADTLTDQPERVIAGEIVREKLLRLLDKEIPHGAAVVVGPSPMSQLDPTLSELARAAVKTYKPVFISWISSTADAAVRRQLDQLPNSRLIAVRSPDEAMFAFGCLASRSASLNARRSPPKPRKNKLSAEALACIRLIFHRVREGGRHTLLPRELHELMRHLGLRPVDGRITHSLEEAQQAARELGWPVAIKASSTALGSRSASGLVFLNLDSAEALADAWKELTTNWAENSPWSQPDGVLVESMSQHAFERELRLGIRLDPVLGPVVEFGGAGLASTLYNDLSVALAPLSQDEAESLAHAPRYAQTLDAYRGLPPINWDELTDALGRLGDLAAALPALRSLRLEPVVPTDNGLLVIDASVALYDAPLIPRRDYPHLVLRPAPIEDQTEARARSGEPLILRALTENDFDAFRTFVMTLSDKSYFYRFHTATRPSTARLAALCRPSWIESGVWGLFAETGALVASGRWSAVQNGGNTDKEAEFGIAVLDSWQRQGLARILMNKLETEAFAEGFHTMVGLVLPGNEAMEHAMTALGYMLDNASAGDSREARRWIRRLQPS